MYINIDKEADDTFLKNYKTSFITLAHRADYIRSLLLYKYGGCWFDLDCFFLKNFDSLFNTYGNEICLYQWERQNYPNNAIYFSLNALDNRMKKNIEFIIRRNRGWGFQQASLIYDLPLDFLVLPCSWFDGDWILGSNPNYFFEFMDREVNFDNFMNGSFCYHWHNNYNKHLK